MLKKIFFAAFLIISSLASAQTDTTKKLTHDSSFVPHSFNLQGSFIVSTFYKNPLLGITGELLVPIDNSRVTITLRPGVWINPTYRNNHFLTLQMGANVRITKKLDFGAYFMNKQAFFPRPYYPEQKLALNEGYNSPFSLFAIATPFKDAKVSIKAEYAYFVRYNIRGGSYEMNKSGFMLSLNYKLLEKIAKE